MNNIFIINIDDINSINIGKCIFEYCKINNIKNSIFYTNNNNEVLELAKKHSVPGNIIYCVGDNQLIKSTMEGMIYSNAYLSIIPTDKKNKFSNYLNNYDKYYFDVCKVNELIFTDSVIIGLDKLPKHSSNELIYKLKILLNANKKDNLDILIDDYKKELLYLFVCTNQYLSKKNISESENNNPFFNVYEIKRINKINLLKNISKILKGSNVIKDKIISYKCDDLFVNSKIPLSCIVDGQKVIGDNFNFSIYPEAILIDIDDRIKVKKYLKDKNMIK